MVKRQFRPVCPDALWRSRLTSDLNEQERSTLAYLLTSPFSSYVGIFELVPRVAAAEMRISETKFRARIARLETLGLVATGSDYILVKVWFLHSSWQVYLKPKATARVPALRAMQQVPHELISSWRVSTEAAGVPATVIEKFLADAQKLAATGDEPMDEDPAAGNLGREPIHTASIPYPSPTRNNTTSTGPHGTDEPHSTTTGKASPVGVGDQDPETHFELHLNDFAEPHRQTVLDEGKDLTPGGRQMLGDELSAHLAAIAAGQREPINSVKAWLHALAEQIRAGFSIAARGLEIAKAREVQQRRSADQRREDHRRRQERDLEVQVSNLMQDSLQRCTLEQRRQVLDAALRKADQTPGKSLSPQARAQVLAGELPGALAGAHVRKSLLELGLVLPDAADPTQ